MKRRSAEMRSVSDIIISYDNEYITIGVKSGDETKYHSFVFGEKEFTINCAEYAWCSVDSMLAKEYEKKIQISINAIDCSHKSLRKQTII